MQPRPAPSEVNQVDYTSKSRLALFALVTIPYALLVDRFNFVCDDAYISFRYARNFAEGLGLRYNVADQPPVEGYSEFLWVLWCAGFEWLGVDVAVAARTTSVLCGLLTLWWVMRFVERRFGLSPSRAALPTAFLATFPPFAMWSTSGLATVPFAFALFAMFDALLREPEQPRWKSAAVWGVLAVGLRADGALLVGIVLAVVGAGALARRNTAALRTASLAGLVVAFAVVLQLAFRLSYYGAWLPNTALAKVTFSSLALEQGRNYLLVMGLTFPAFVLIPLLAIAWLCASRRSAQATLELLAIPFGVAAYIGLVAGGDWMPMARMLIPSVPFLAALLAIPLHDSPSRVPALRGVPLALPVLMIAISLPPAFDRHLVPDSIRYQFRIRAPIAMSEHQFWALERDRTRRWAVLGRALEQLADPSASLVMGPIGAVGYYSRLHIYDSFGLVNREVAHRGVSDAEVRNPWRPPGHHKGVPKEFFLPERPTYLAADLVERPIVSETVPGYRTVFLTLPAVKALGATRILRLLERIDP